VTQEDRELVARLRKPVWWQALVGDSNDADSFWRDSYAPHAAASRIEALSAQNELLEMDERERIITYLKNQALHFEQELKNTEQRHGILRSEYAIHRKSCLASARAIAIGEHLK
jgi:hypothetical protein